MSGDSFNYTHCAVVIIMFDQELDALEIETAVADAGILKGGFHW